MNSIQKICDDLKGLDGAVGAFVWNDGNCLASSLPKNYDSARLEQTGSELARLSLLAQKASYAQCSYVFHWQRGVLFSWGLRDNGILAVLTLPSAPRGVVELSASIAIEELLPLLAGTAQVSSQPAIPAAPPAISITTLPDTDAAPRSSETMRASVAEEHPKLRELEDLVICELGPTGRVLFTRARQKTYRAGLAESQWLLPLRAAVLADLGDPTAWTVVAASVLWLPSPA